MKKKAQAWGFDLIVATTLFIAGIVVFYIYSLNYPSEGKDTLDSLAYEGENIADSLLAEGLPKSWNQVNVVRIGITDSGKINETKLEELYTMTITDTGYQTTRELFNTKYDYYFNFTEPITIQNNPVGFIGRKPISPINLIKVTRFTTYKNKAVSLNIFMWQE